MIEFTEAHRSVQDLVAGSLESFAAENPDVKWSMFALYACPWAGWIVSSFDTEAHSDQHLLEFSKNGPNWYGEDAWGRYCNNCPSFQFHCWRDLELTDWSSEYNTE